MHIAICLIPTCVTIKHGFFFSGAYMCCVPVLVPLQKIHYAFLSVTTTSFYLYPEAWCGSCQYNVFGNFTFSSFILLQCSYRVTLCVSNALILPCYRYLWSLIMYICRCKLVLHMDLLSHIYFLLTWIMEFWCWCDDVKDYSYVHISVVFGIVDKLICTINIGWPIKQGSRWL